jgi:hypothetical protein
MPLLFCSFIPSYCLIVFVHCTLQILDGLGTTGQLVFDVELVDAFDDDADLGYYSDDGLTLEELQVCFVLRYSLHTHAFLRCGHMKYSIW